MSTARSHATYRVGDRIRFDFGRSKVTGVIVEDRGALGIEGRHIYQISVPMDPFEPMMVAMQEDELETADDLPIPPINKEKLIEYLTYGGLVSILRSIDSLGRSQSRAWICFGNLGNLTHTFNAERGVVGGQPIPYLALRGDKILVSKRDSVVEFVESFGLNHREAEKVVSEVGTAL